MKLYIGLGSAAKWTVQCACVTLFATMILTGDRPQQNLKGYTVALMGIAPTKIEVHTLPPYLPG
jgi:hypothetical protein